MFSKLIEKRKKDPLGQMLIDYFHGNKDATIIVESPEFEIWTMAGVTMFRTHNEMNMVEQTALSRCYGDVLDVGAGSGCHSLYLQDKGLSVQAIDISPGCVEVMHQRGVQDCRHANMFALRQRKFDTILMLMNGLGICGSLDGLNLFFQLIGDLLVEGGQVLADSTDFTHSFQLDLPSSSEDYPGETEFVMRYGECESDPFPWVYVDFATLCSLAEIHELQCQCLLMQDDGRYLARIAPV